MSDDDERAPQQAPPPPQSAPRRALALGFAGALGEELLSLLLGSSEYLQVHVGVTQQIGSATARFVPWVVGQPAPAVDEAWLCLTGPETFAPKGSPIRRYGEDDVLEAARLARAAGARRLVVIAPLAALLQMSAGASYIGSQAEMELATMGFERLVIIRPTAADSRERARDPLTALMRALGRAVAGIMLPRYAQQLAPRTAALAIMEGVRTAQARVTVLGARDLLALIEAHLPQLAPRRLKLR